MTSSLRHLFKQRHASVVKRIATGTLFAALLVPGIAWAESVSFKPVFMDPLETPAVQAPRAQHGLLLGATRAGDRLVAVGERGHILYSDDEARSWTQAEVPVSLTMTAVDFATPELGWAVGHDGVILHSSDGGRTWIKQFDGRAGAKQLLRYAKDKLAAATAALDDADGGDQEALQQAYDDAELAVWDAQDSAEFAPSEPLFDVWFHTPSTGFVVGSYGQVFRTDNGGQDWLLWKAPIHNPRNYHLYGISELPSGALLLVGEQGGIHRSADQGHSWEKLQSPYTGSLYRSLAFQADGEEVVLLLGFGGHVYRSTDGGDSWRQVEVPERKSINDGTVLADGSVLLVGHDGVMMRSMDGGRSFTASLDRRRQPFMGVLPVNNGPASSGPSGSVMIIGAGGAQIVVVDNGEGNKQ